MGTSASVVYQSTTRSPVYPVDVAGYAIRTATTFPAPDDPSRDSFVYNVAGRRYDDVVLVVDGVLGHRAPAPGDGLGAASGAVEALRAVAPVTVVRLPAHDPARRG